MKQEVLKHFDVPWLPLTALVLFVVCFAAYTYWTYRKANRPHFESVSRIPLEDPSIKTNDLQGKIS